MVSSAKNSNANRRRFLRLRTAFPLEFKPLIVGIKSDFILGFTSDLSWEGLRIRCNSLPSNIWKRINDETQVEIFLHIPIIYKKIRIVGEVIWKEYTQEEFHYDLGVKFIDISKSDRKFLSRFTWINFLTPKLSYLLIFLFIIFLGFGVSENIRISKNNRRLVEKLSLAVNELSTRENSFNQSMTIVKMLEDRISLINKELKDKTGFLDVLKKDFNSLQENKKELEDQNRDMSTVLDKMQYASLNIKKLEDKISSLEKENAYLKQTVSEEKSFLKKQQIGISEIYTIQKDLSQTSIEQMYKWIKRRQNQDTGLVISYEGDNSLEGWAFTYDQALSVFVFMNFSDYESAKKILDFYLNKATRDLGGFLNGYYASSGDPCEYIVHTGPNVWIGLAAIRFYEYTKQREYLDLAEKIAVFLGKMEDREGGFIGGPTVSWYSTEHNLDAYSFLDSLYKITGKKEYLSMASRVLSWIEKYSYTKKEIPINRGKGDSSIATDTYAWSIAALGPELLLSLDMDSDQILEFAIEKCKVKTIFNYKNKSITLEGFDFARNVHLARGGVVSAEWTGQMIVSFEIMARFYKDRQDLYKYKYYIGLAKKYFMELSKMVISSPSPIGQGRGCIPYASDISVDTGHGWKTPSGKNTGSVSATAYYIFAYLGYNPLNPNIEAIGLNNLDN